MLVQVTHEDIDNGLKASRTCCPVALALARAFPQHRVNVGSMAATIVGTVVDTWIKLPLEAADFIKAFDRGTSVYPFAFDLDLSFMAYEEKEISHVA